MAFGKRAGKKTGPSVTADGGRLTIDCRACGGPACISDGRCAACICGVVKSTGEIDSILIRSATDTAYHGEAVELVRDLASAYAMATADLADRRGSRCRMCRKSFAHIMADQLPLFPEIDIEALRQRTAQIPVSNEVCGICVSDSARMAEELWSALCRLSARMAEYSGGGF